MAIAGLLELFSTEAVAKGLDETPETIARWRAAGAIPETRAADLLDWAVLKGPLQEISQIAQVAAPRVGALAGRLHDLGKAGTAFQDQSARRDANPVLPKPLMRIIDATREYRVSVHDPVARVRSVRSDWVSRDDRHSGTGSGERDR